MKTVELTRLVSLLKSVVKARSFVLFLEAVGNDFKKWIDGSVVLKRNQFLD